jgi:pyridoxal phosphate enzyme (YggS family)
VSLIADNLARVRDRIARAGNAELIAVTKTVPPALVEEAVAAGQLVFGESKVQEAKAKIPVVSSRARWHLVGHLQSNKARDAVALFDLIHSVDSVKLAAELAKWAERAGKTQAILLEVNISGEASKFGFRPEDLPGALAQINALPRIEVAGLMTVPPAGKDARPFFRQLREWRDRLGVRELSMGMSTDFEAAIEEGATLVRVGTAIFGERAIGRDSGPVRGEP